MICGLAEMTLLTKQEKVLIFSSDGVENHLDFADAIELATIDRLIEKAEDENTRDWLKSIGEG